MTHREPASRPLALCSQVKYWHSLDVTCYVKIERCPVCSLEHPVVVLYNWDNHIEWPPQDFLNNVLLPCGVMVDLILEREGGGY